MTDSLFVSPTQNRTMDSAEQRARDLLERIGVEDAQAFSSGDLVELANLLVSQSAVQEPAAPRLSFKDDSLPCPACHQIVPHRLFGDTWRCSECGNPTSVIELQAAVSLQGEPAPTTPTFLPGTFPESVEDDETWPFAESSHDRT